MKKVVAGLLALIMVFALAGCSDSKETNVDKNKTAIIDNGYFVMSPLEYANTLNSIANQTMLEDGIPIDNHDFETFVHGEFQEGEENTFVVFYKAGREMNVFLEGGIQQIISAGAIVDEAHIEDGSNVTTSGKTTHFLMTIQTHGLISETLETYSVDTKISVDSFLRAIDPNLSRSDSEEIIDDLALLDPNADSWGSSLNDEDELVLYKTFERDGVTFTIRIMPDQWTIMATPEALNVSESTPSPTYSAIVYDVELGSGHYTAGVDFPAGVYDLTAVKGGGNVSSDNSFSGGINAIMGVEDDDFYQKEYANISLPVGTKLSIDGLTIKMHSDAASGAPLISREQSITEEVELGNGNFVSGTDFPAGIYDIIAISGGGNVSSDNIYDGGINAIMGPKDDDFYIKEYNNIELASGTTLKVDGVKIKLVPSE